MHFSVYDSIYPRLNLESSQRSLLLSCDLDVSIQILGWIVWINYFDTRHTTVFDQFDSFSIGLRWLPRVITNIVLIERELENET